MSLYSSPMPIPADEPASVRRRYSLDNHKRAMSTSTSPGKKSKRAPAQPLRRGDACLMCRAKKLKCSATKPTCDQCTKRNDRCVYDAVRPASRVEKLEKKLAEMEEQELLDVMARRHSTSTVAQNLSNMSFQPTTTSTPFDFSMFQFAPTDTPTLSDMQSDSPEARPSSMPNPSAAGMESWNWGNTNPFTPMPTQAVQMDAMPWSILGMSQDVSLWDNNMLNVPVPMPMDMQFDIPGLGIEPLPSGSTSSTLVEPQALPAPIKLDPVAAILPTAAASTIEEVNQTAHAVTTTLGEKDISQSARDYLLDLFFAPPREAFGTEMFTEAQFRAKLTSTKRPHSCLLFAMYTIAASSSYIPAVRALADSLYTIASTKVDEAISQDDRLFDVIRASKMLSKWLYSKARAIEGYQMGWKSVSLALACQLHKIPTGIYTAGDPRFANTAENPWAMLGPPKDQLELGERIHAFWSVWGNDCGASIMVPWPSAIADETIITPLPRAPDFYADGRIVNYPDMHISDLYVNPEMIKTLYRPFTFLILGCHLLKRAKALRDCAPENARTYAGLEAQRNRPFSARRDHPAAYAEIMAGIQTVQNNWPESLRINVLESPPWSHLDVPTIHVALLAARVTLHDIDGDAVDFEEALRTSRELAGIIKLWIRQMKIDELRESRNRRGISRNKNGLGGPFILNPWFWTADRLIRASEILKRQGRTDEASQCREDGGMIVAGLRSLGVSYHLGAVQVDPWAAEKVTLNPPTDSLASLAMPPPPMSSPQQPLAQALASTILP